MIRENPKYPNKVVIAIQAHFVTDGISGLLAFNPYYSL